MKDKKIAVYLAGAMEFDRSGNNWRTEVTRYLAKYDIEVLNPYNFEPRQLKGLQPRRLPKQFVGRDGQIVKPTHWHQLKLAVRTSSLYSRFKRYMRLIVSYDLNVVRSEADYVICLWTVNTGKGAGTHCELAAAYESRRPVYLVQDVGADVPAWTEACCTRVYNSWEELYKMLDEEFVDYLKEETDVQKG
jgi:hypothetical protein